MNIFDIFNKIKNEKRAIAQFNVSDNNQLRGIIEAVKKYNCPVIIGLWKTKGRFLA